MKKVEYRRGHDPGVPKVTPWPGDILDNYRKEGPTKEGWDTLLYDCDRAQELIAAHERDGERYREHIAKLEGDIDHIRNRLRAILEAEWK